MTCVLSTHSHVGHTVAEMLPARRMKRIRAKKPWGCDGTLAYLQKLASKEHEENLAQADRHLEKLLEQSKRQHEETLQFKRQMLADLNRSADEDRKVLSQALDTSLKTIESILSVLQEKEWPATSDGHTTAAPTETRLNAGELLEVSVGPGSLAGVDPNSTPSPPTKKSIRPQRPKRILSRDC